MNLSHNRLSQAAHATTGAQPVLCAHLVEITTIRTPAMRGPTFDKAETAVASQQRAVDAL